MALARKVTRLASNGSKKWTLRNRTHQSRYSSGIDRREYSHSRAEQQVAKCNKTSDDITGSSDVIAAGAASIADIERLMAELQAARDYLLAEGERVRQINANYAHLAQTASASARVICREHRQMAYPGASFSVQAPDGRGPKHVRMLEL